jgi:5-oxoprolinase (ATP-hydrolysing)
MLQSVEVLLPECFLNPKFDPDPALCPAVVGGNVETSQRVVDTLIRALGFQACSQGTMNNFLFGDESFGYYETICGGSGAGDGYDGTSGIHTHMTNTAITDPEILEQRYPVRLLQFSLRTGSGGKGKWSGGDGVVRELEFLRPLHISLLTQHRAFAPFGMAGGNDGACGFQTLNEAKLDGITSFDARPGDRLKIETPGGGGWGNA